MEKQGKLPDLDEDVVEMIKTNDLIKVDFERGYIEFYDGKTEKPNLTVSFHAPSKFINETVRGFCE
jgi:hypothetical protein